LRQLLVNPPGEFKDQATPLNRLVAMVVGTATNASERIGERSRAIRVLARATPKLAGNTILTVLSTVQPAEIQMAAARALAELDDAGLAKATFAQWPQYPAKTRRILLAAAPSSRAMTTAAADALEQKKLSSVELDASLRQSLLKTNDRELQKRFKQLFQTTVSPDREQVLRTFQPALALEGNRSQGAALFARSCLLCHTIQGHGQQVGPDLSAIGSRPREALLVDILDPSRQVSPDFINYTLVTTKDDSVSGFIVSETGAAITLRRSGAPDETVLRSQIKELGAEEKSLMPEGLEQGLTSQDMADLLSFLQKPDAQLLPK